jgi:hypothetical protein
LAKVIGLLPSILFCVLCMNVDVLLRMYQGLQKLPALFLSSSRMLLTPFFAVVDDGILSSTNEGHKSEESYV